MHGILNRRNELIVLDDFDIALPVERDVSGKRVPLVMNIKEANKKTVNDI